MHKRMLRLAGMLIPTATLLAGCEGTPCTPTQTAARDAAVADIKAPLDSAVLEASLTAGGKGVGSRTIRFLVDDSGRTVGEATTTDAGVARLDLKRSPAKVVGPVRAGAYRAVFAGDFTYCGSQDGAAFKPARV